MKLMSRPKVGSLSILVFILFVSCISIVGKQIIGQTEVIEVVDASLKFQARIDTGAKRTSIHAINLSVSDSSEVMKDNIGKAITFTIVNELDESKEVTKIIEDVTKVKNPQGEELRYVVKMELAWGRVYSKKVTVSLRNRQRMKYKLLIGRNWLENDFVVDVTREVHD
ncbi:MAG: hypothetical protein GWN00_37950 [Aliifodinibius sp.]|nr:hypothetical protein [Fodinibius sp.]NIV16387.1 hypothetical protein [Fodinibius sp.]NIY30361.1 hypothetical protein [Fodinibius sp.]